MMSASGKTQECPSCAMHVDAKAETCPICGYEFPRQKKSTVIGVWLLIFLMLAWVFL
ncbi:MAG: zinc ribbon domain-containing protein [Cyclonatronaceae bacterium]